MVLRFTDDAPPPPKASESDKAAAGDAQPAPAPRATLRFTGDVPPPPVIDEAELPAVMVDEAAKPKKSLQFTADAPAAPVVVEEPVTSPTPTPPPQAGEGLEVAADEAELPSPACGGGGGGGGSVPVPEDDHEDSPWLRFEAPAPVADDTPFADDTPLSVAIAEKPTIAAPTGPLSFDLGEAGELLAVTTAEEPRLAAPASVSFSFDDADGPLTVATADTAVIAAPAAVSLSFEDSDAPLAVAEAAPTIAAAPVETSISLDDSGAALPQVEEPPAPAPVAEAAPAAAEPAPPAAPPGGDAPPPPPPPPPSGGSGNGGGKPPGGGGGGGGQKPGQPPQNFRIGDRLVELGLISNDQLQVALYEKKRSPKMIGELLVSLGFITESALSAVLAQASGHERFDPKAVVVDADLLRRIPKELAQRLRVFPVSQDKAEDGLKVRLAMADPYDVIALDQAKRALPPGTEIIPAVCTDSEITQAIDLYYGYELSIDGILKELETGKHDISAAAISGDGSYEHPLVRLVNAILLDAIKVAASDIHFEPEGSFLRLRYRIDGVMMQIRTLHKDHWAAISHRLKIVSGMNIADKLNPQDGRMSFSLGNRKVDFRVAALPTVHGENIVIRILDKTRALMPIDGLGLSEANVKLLLKMLKRPEGIIIVTGPTGSGKTTTLYGVLNHISSLEKNIMTLEDPVEYELPLIRQSQVREGTGLNFSEGVRALLRQDPDVIFIGEIRDQATAQMALRAAMTGHQVFATLHTNDAAGAIPRLHDLGLEHGLLANNIIGIVAQRLARRLCTNCMKKRTATEEECRILGVDPADPPEIGHPVGCEECRHTGHKGRIALHEILPLNKELDELLLAGESLNRVRRESMNYGFIPMLDDAAGKVLAGIISMDSMSRTVDITERL